MNDQQNKKHIKGKTTYEFDIDSFEKIQAYQITLSEGGIRQSSYIGILVHTDPGTITFMVVKDLDGDCDNPHGKYGRIHHITFYGVSIQRITFTIDEYMTGDISIRKLGVVEND